jgi:hypothetical protein
MRGAKLPLWRVPHIIKFCTYSANLAGSGQKARVRYNRGWILIKGLEEAICKCRDDAVPLKDALRNKKERGDRFWITVCSNFEDLPFKIQGE